MRRVRATSLAVLILLSLSACAEKPKQGLTLSPAGFGELVGWTEDAIQDALPAFEQSCNVFLKRSPDKSLLPHQAGKTKQWQDICRKLPPKAKRTQDSARAFFENNFTVYRIEHEEAGLFTGYYEAQTTGSLRNEGPYQFPLWNTPKDYIKGKPYEDRASIAKGALWGRAKPIMWLEDPIDGFFLEIQGSGRVKLPDGSVRRLGYAAQNGHAYVPIGRVLLEEGAIERPVSMQKIRNWLDAHPTREAEILNTNPSYVFFRFVEEGPVGAMGVPVTPMRSLAIDPAHVPLGVPVWLETENHKRLVIAQDTGGAIKGAVRGDLFWGAGVAAEEGAGKMQETGRYWLLLPKRKGSNER